MRDTLPALLHLLADYDPDAGPSLGGDPEYTGVLIVVGLIVLIAVIALVTTLVVRRLRADDRS